MKVVFAIPTIDGKITSKTHQSLVATYRVLNVKRIPYDELIIYDCPYLPTARNTLVAMFLADADATDLFFVDSDVGFNAGGALRILDREEELVAGIYPLKKDEGGYPVEIKVFDGMITPENGLIEADFLPTGFMRIKRTVFERMMDAYPELKYAENVVEIRNAGIGEAYDFFNMGVDKERQRWTTEDFAFCQRWRDIGGRCWVYPDIDFWHVGRKEYSGNYLKHLMGSNDGDSRQHR